VDRPGGVLSAGRDHSAYGRSDRKTVMRRRYVNRAGGFTVMECTVTLVLIAMMTALFAAALMQHQRVTRLYAQHRTAIQQAEQVMHQLQQGEDLTEFADETVTLTWLDDPAPASMRWVQVQVADHWDGFTLIGLAPRPPREAQP